ncbi:MAG: hypothetical protein GF346_10445, partial [Candidatus Eisenbacteria bacterium]|nr:hypothetical protein [Candidatus Eisenbacteria bacterium]
MPAVWMRGEARCRGTEGEAGSIRIASADGWTSISGRFLVDSSTVPSGPFVARGRLVPLGGQGVPG